MSMNSYMLERVGSVYYLSKQTIELREMGYGHDAEWRSDWEEIYSSKIYEDCLDFYAHSNFKFAGDLIDLETFGMGTYGGGESVTMPKPKSKVRKLIRSIYGSV